MMEDFKFYEVGGKIRDEFLGIKSKDVDYVAVPSKEVFDKIHPRESQPSPAMLVFDELKDYLEKQKFEIFLVTPRCYTIRAKFPEGHKYQGIADFVMARKEVGYIPGTRTPIIYPGTLYDDLSRRDFTVNALAKDPDTGEIVDYFNGMKDIWGSIIRTPLDPVKTFDDDPLAAGFYRIELVRPVTSEEIEKDSSRWNGYKVGDKTNAFYSPEDVIAIAKEVCKARFLGNWKLKIVDYSGKDLDSEILISEL